MGQGAGEGEPSKRAACQHPHARSPEPTPHSRTPWFQLNPNPHRGTIFTSPSDAHWAAVRKAVLPALSTRTVRASFPALAAATAAVGAWVAAAAAAGPGGVGADVDVDDACLRGSLDGAAAAAFGLRLGSVPPPGGVAQRALFELMRECEGWEGGWRDSGEFWSGVGA